MRNTIKVTAIMASLMLLFTGVPALAMGSSDSGSHDSTETRTTSQSGESENHASDSNEKQEEAKTHLADAKLKACQNREHAINNIMSRIADRGQKQLNLFSSIADRTEKFYTDKGKPLSNYDMLVADVNAKKAAAQTTIDTIKSDSVTFKCDGTDPKGAAASFKTALTSEIAALKAYKTAVKNLIVGVKSVQGTTQSTENTSGGTQ